MFRSIAKAFILSFIIVSGNFAPTAYAGLVSKSFQWARNPDDTVDGAYPLDEKPPTIEELTWNLTSQLGGAGFRDILVGTPFEHDLRQYLLGTERLTADITLVYVSGDDFAAEGGSLTEDCGTGSGDGDCLEHSALQTGSGVVAFLATSASGSVQSNGKNWEVTNPVSVPGQVTGLQLSVVNDDAIDLLWTAVSGADSYTIRRDTVSIATGVTDIDYADTGLEPSTEYDYTVQAVNGAGAGTESAIATATTAPASGDFNPPYPRLGGRHQGSLDGGISQSTLNAQLAIISKDHVFLTSQPRTNTWGTSTNLATLPAAIHNAGSPYPGYETQVFLYSNMSQVDTANTWITNKLQAEEGAGGNGDWVLRTAAGAIVPGNAANKWSINYSTTVTPDSNGLRWPQWLARMWGAPPSDTEDWIAPSGNKGRGITEGDWAGLYADDQSFANVKTGDWDEDGVTDNKNDADVKAWADAAFIAYGVGWKTYAATRGKPNAMFSGNLSELGSHAIVWPVSRRNFYEGGLCERITGYEKNRGFGDYQNLDTNGEPGTGFMGRYWRSMQYTKSPKLVMFENDLIDVRADFAAISPENTFSDWRWVRYYLVASMMDDGYYGVNQETPTWNTPTPWYDEYDGGLGVKATGYLGWPILATPPRDPTFQGVWTREFDNGIAILNPYGNGQRTLSIVNTGLPDPGVGKNWDRIQCDPSLGSGSQDCTHNNNATNVTSITLQAHDAIILLRVNE